MLRSRLMFAFDCRDRLIYIQTVIRVLQQLIIATVTEVRINVNLFSYVQDGVLDVMPGIFD